MPIYQVRNKDTGEIRELFMKIADWEEYKVAHPEEPQYFTGMNFQDSVSLGIKKPPIEFKECVIDKIKRNNPLHNMSSRWD